ncbi:MAG: hypothetical protein DRJ42_18795 [Deltaproteobacteria bacterium]|nr:MAG: hypothetical protein DRJ42_18795 [Deltaproteobacteria bacterium]
MRRPSITLWLSGAAFVALVFTTGAAPAAAQVGVRVAEVPDGAVRVDGSLRDWREVTFATLGRGSNASLRYALGADRRGFYLAAEVRDQRMVRTARPGPNEDAIVLTFAMPARRGYTGTEVSIYAGIPGRQAGSATVGAVGSRPSPARGVRVVEGPRRGGAGYIVEAFIPFAAIPGAARWQEGRLAVRLVDVDSEARPEVANAPASERVDPRHLERLPSIVAEGGEAGMLRTFLHSRGIEGATPRFDLRGDVQGDARPERIVVVNTFIVIMGEGYRDGAAFDFFQLPITSAAEVRSGQLTDLDRSGKKELVLTLRQQDQRGSRDLFQSFSFNDGIRPHFGLEVRKQTHDGFVEARVSVRPQRRGPPLIEVRAGRAEGLDAENFRESPAAGVEPILLPWGPHRSRTYRWDGRRFAILRETPNPRYVDPATARRDQPSGRTERAAPVPPSVDQMLVAFKRQAGLPRNARPSVRIDTNVADTPTAEHLFVFGTNLVVLGTDFRGGNGFFHFQIPANSAADVVSVQAADLTGDGRAEVLIRIRRVAGDVIREVLLVQQFRRSEFARILAVEVARTQGTNSIQNEVRVIGRGNRRRLTIGPGRARGWSREAWPFAEGGTGDGIEALLLPWRDEQRRYRYAGGRLSP